MPKITVLMPVYNAERYVAGAIDSVLAQTEEDWELLIIDDGSTDSSPEIMAAYSDPRISVTRTQNGGVAAALNHGVKLAAGHYLARLDADDLAHPHRLASQAAVLDRQPEVGLVHSFARSMNSAGETQGSLLGQMAEDLETKWCLIWRNVLIHPSVMLRRSVLIKNKLNYSLAHNKVEDFRLWNELALHTQILGLDAPLIDYRVHEASVTGSNRAEEHLNAYAPAVQQNLAQYGVVVDDELVREIAIIGGGSAYDPRVYSYSILSKQYQRVLADTLTGFCRQHGCSARELANVRAGQCVLWARNILATSRTTSARLLVKALWLSPQSLFRTPIYKVALLLLVPKLNAFSVSRP